MKYLIPVSEWVIVVLLIVFFTRICSPEPKCDKEKQELKQLQDTLKILKGNEKQLVKQIAVYEKRIAITRDSIIQYKYLLGQTQKRYEKILNGMFYWSDDMHIWFFTTATNNVE
jgi:hypothetical protein